MQPSTPAPLSTPVFTLRPSQTHLKITPSDSVTAVSATGGLFWVGTATGRLLRHDTLSNTTDELRGRLGVGRLDNAVWRIHADPHTYAALVMLRNADGYHALGSGLVRPRWLAKLRGLRCVSCTWLRTRLPPKLPTAKSAEASVALLGTALGALFSLLIDDKYEKDDVIAKLWSAPNGETIDGIRVEQVAGKYVGTVATTSALYLFSDAHSLADLFTEEHTTVVSRTTDAISASPSASQSDLLLPSELQFMTGNSGLASRRFVWAAAAGVTHAQLAVRRRRTDRSAEEPGASPKPRSTVIASVVDKETISWARLKQTSGSAVPLACNLSAFHVLVLYPGSVFAFNHISGLLTQRIPVWNPVERGASMDKSADWPSPRRRKRMPSLSEIPSTPRPRDSTKRTSLGWEDGAAKPFLSSPAAGFARDVLTDTLWIYTEDGEFSCLVAAADEEQTEAWKAAKAMGRFDLAMALAPLVSSAISDEASFLQTREAVFEAQADHAAAEGNWDVAAQLYAKTNRPIETVILDIVDACSLPTKAKGGTGIGDGSNLASLGVGSRLQMTKHIIIYLVRKLDRMDTSKPAQRTVMATLLVQLYATQLVSERDEKLRDEIRKDFGHFLADRHEDLDIGTAMNVLAKNGCHDEAWNLALLSGNVLAASELSSGQGKIDKTISLLKNESVSSNEDMLNQLISSLSGSLLQLAPQKVATAISRSMKKDVVRVDHIIVIQGLARVAREVKNEQKSKDAYQSAVSYLYDLLHDWGTGTSKTSSASDLKWSEAVQSQEWCKLVTFLFQLHAEFGKEAEAQRSYDHLVAPRIKKGMSSETQDVIGPILRSAESGGFSRLCVHLYQALDLHEAAISLAVDIDPKLAEKKVALLGNTNIPENVKRNLWCLVASKSDDPVGVVERSKGLLHIEDVLNSMPQFESATERIKVAVANSLEEHKRLANAAKSDAAAALEVTSALREDLERSRVWHSERQTQRSRHRFRAFSCGHRTRARSPAPNGTRECALCGTKAISSVDAPFDSGHHLPLKTTKTHT